MIRENIMIMSGILIQFIDLLNPYKVIYFISSFPLFELLQNLMFSNAAFQVWKPIVCHGGNIEELGIVNGSAAELLTSFTVSFWVNISDDNAGAILSYAYECNGDCENGLMIEMNSRLTFFHTLKPNFGKWVKRRY